MRVQVLPCDGQPLLWLTMDRENRRALVDGLRHRRWLDVLLIGQGEQELGFPVPILIASSRVKAITISSDFRLCGPSELSFFGPVLYHSSRP